MSDRSIIFKAIFKKNSDRKIRQIDKFDLSMNSTYRLIRLIDLFESTTYLGNRRIRVTDKFEESSNSSHPLIRVID